MSKTGLIALLREEGREEKLQPLYPEMKADLISPRLWHHFRIYSAVRQFLHSRAELIQDWFIPILIRLI